MAHVVQRAFTRRGRLAICRCRRIRIARTTQLVGTPLQQRLDEFPHAVRRHPGRADRPCRLGERRVISPGVEHGLKNARRGKFVEQLARAKLADELSRR